MAKTFISLILIFFCSLCRSQSIQSDYPEVLTLSTDSFRVKFSDASYSWTLTPPKSDTVDVGTDGHPGLYATIFFNEDSLRIYYKRFPYNQIHFIHFRSPGKSFIYRLHFNAVHAKFTTEYVSRHKNKIFAEIPEVYELANVLWTMSPTGQRIGDFDTTSLYYQKVYSFFKPFSNHPVFASLNFGNDDYLEKYYDFRENSFPFNFSGNKLIRNGPYFYVNGDDFNYSSLFSKLLPLIEDFVARSGYRKFYKNNHSFYDAEVKKQKELLPIQSMWTWLEQQFPQTNKFDSYKIIFSPLIGRSHSTQQFSTKVNEQWYN